MSNRTPGAAAGWRSPEDDGDGRLQPVPPVMVAALLGGGGDGRDRFVCESVGRFVLAAVDASPALREAVFEAVSHEQFVDAGLLRTRAVIAEPALGERLPEPTDVDSIRRLADAAGIFAGGAFRPPPGGLADARLSVAAEVLRRGELPLDRTACRDFLDDYERHFETAHRGFPKSDGTRHLPLTGGLLRRDGDGRLAVSADQERAFLQHRLEAMADHFRRPLTLPPAADGGPPRHAAGWGPFADTDPALRAYFAVRRADRLRASAEAGVFRPGVGDIPTLSVDAAPPADGLWLTPDRDGAGYITVRLPELSLLAYQTYATRYGRGDYDRGQFNLEAWRDGAGGRRKPLIGALRRACGDRELAETAAESLIFGLGDDAAVALARVRGRDDDLAARVAAARHCLLETEWTGFAANLHVDPYNTLARVAGLGDAYMPEHPRDIQKALGGIDLRGDGPLAASVLHVFVGDSRRQNRELMFRQLKKVAGIIGDPAAVDRVERCRQSPQFAGEMLQIPACGAGDTPGGSVEESMTLPAGVLLTRGEILAAAVFELERAGTRPAALLNDGILCYPPGADLGRGVVRCREAVCGAVGGLLPGLNTPVQVEPIGIF